MRATTCTSRWIDVPSNYDDERRRRDAEIDTIAARLIREGTPPWRAMEMAVEELGRRRRRQAPQ
jgi:hypothetical protein